MSHRLPRFDKEALQELQAAVSPKLRVASRRVFRQVALFIAARLPSGARDDRPIKERVATVWTVFKDEGAAQWERLHNVRSALGPRLRAIGRELRTRLDVLRRGRGL